MKDNARTFGQCEVCAIEKATRIGYINQLNLLLCAGCYTELHKQNPIKPEKLYQKHGVKKSEIRKVYDQAIAEGKTVYRFRRLYGEIMIGVWTAPPSRGGRLLFNYPEE